MVRVYDSTQLPCSCVLEDSDWGILPLEVEQISRTGALLRTRMLFTAEARYESVLKFSAGGPSMILTAQVVNSGEDGLRVRWRHESSTAADEFEQLLDDSARDPAGGNGRVLAADGSLDIRSSLLRQARTVSSHELATRKRHVRVLRMDDITRFITEAVDVVISRMGGTVSARDREQLMQEAEAIFNDRLSELQAEKADVETRARELSSQLENARHLLEEERQKVVTSQQFTVSDAGMIQLEERLGRLVDQAVRGGGVSSSLEDEMRSVMEKLLDGEREKISARAREAHSDSIDLLERKVKRLARTLEEAQRERDRARRRASALEANSNVAFGNIMTAGLDDGDPDYEMKMNLLVEIVEHNRTLRQQMVLSDSTPESGK